MMAITGVSKDWSATCTDSRVVALESLKKATPLTSPSFSKVCGTPRKPRTATWMDALATPK